MRRLFVLPATILVLGIGSCEHMPDAGFLDQIQQAAIRKCSFVPTIRTLLALINAHPNWTNAADIADRICAVVTPPTPRGVAPMLENVPISGQPVGPPR